MSGRTPHPHTDGHGFTVALGPKIIIDSKDPRSTLNIKDPSGSGNQIALRRRTFVASKAIVNFGGLFESLNLIVDKLSVFVLPDQSKAYFLEDVSVDLADLDLGGLILKNLAVSVKDLTNHPDVYGRTGWYGTVRLGASSLLVPSIAGLSLTPAVAGKDALGIGYNFATKSLELDLNSLAYRNSQVDLSASGRLVIDAGSSQSADLTFSGSGSLALTSLGLPPVRGGVTVVVDNKSLTSLRLQVDVDAKQPITPLALSGGLIFEHDVNLSKGQIQLSNARLFDLPVTGNLSYDSTGIRSELGLDPAVPASLDLGGVQLGVRGGTLGIDYLKTQSDAWGGSVKLSGSFDVAIGGSQASFRGDLSFGLHGSSAPALQSAELQLTSDCDINLGGFNLRLLAADPLAPTKLSLVSSKGSLVPSLSGKVAFRDLSDLQLTVPEGGISYGAKGWAFNDVQLSLGQNLDLGPLRLGSETSARYQSGKVTFNPDLYVNLDTFNLALRPLGQLVSDVVVPITAPIVKVFNTNIDLGSVDSVRTIMDKVKDWAGKFDLTIDLASAWSGLVGYLEDVPGNPYKDKVLTAGELLDFVNYRAFDFVQKNPGTANTAFKAVFNTDLPSWLLNLPQGINYADISMSATVARLDAINKLAAALLNLETPTNQWVPVPMTIELGANSTEPALSGGDAAKQALEAQLRQLSAGLQKLDQLSQNQAPVAVREAKTLPLKFGYGFAVPLYDDTINTVLKLIGNKPFDVVRSDFSLSSGAELNFALPLAELAAAYPPASATLKAINAKVDLRTGLGAQLALSLGLTSSAPSLLAIGKDISSNLAQTPAALLKLFAGSDPVTGSALGLYVGQTPGTPMLQLTPSVQAGLGGGRFGLDVLAFGRADGTINVNFTSADGSNRAYLQDVLTGLASLPGIKATARVNGTVGINSSLGDVSTTFPIIDDATLLDVAPRSNALLAALPEPWTQASPSATDLAWSGAAVVNG